MDEPKRRVEAAMGTAYLILALLPCAYPASAGQGPAFDGPQPVLTLEELRGRLVAGSGTELSLAVDQAARLGPDYSWLLADLLRRDDLSVWADRICKGLARNGDARSLVILREAAGDTNRPWAVRERAVSALAYARDRESLPLLQEVSARSDDRILAGAAEEAIRRIESPGLYRPLIEIENGRLYYGFLVDDLESIEYAEPPALSHSFGPGEFRRICELLQSGTLADAQGTSMYGALTFTLKDGAAVTLPTDGAVFGNMSGLSMESPGLRELISSALGRAERRGEPRG